MKAKLLLIEEEWQKLSPDNHFATYREQFSVLVYRNDTVKQYLKVRDIRDDPYEALISARAAHIGEQSVLRLFWLLWIGMAIVAVVLVLLNVKSTGCLITHGSDVQGPSRAEKPPLNELRKREPF